MKHYFLTAFLLLSFTAQARTLTCEIKINSSVVARGKLNSQLQQKVPIIRLQSAAFFVTEKPNNFFSMEVYLPAYEARVFGEGHLRNPEDRVSVSFWSREALLEANCQQ